MPPIKRDIPDYPGLDFFAAQEIPYTCVEPEVHSIIPNLSDGFPQDPTKPQFDPGRMVSRHGWLKGASVYSGSQQRLLTDPDPREDGAADPNDFIYLRRDDGSFLVMKPTGPTFSSDEADMTNRVRIAKAVCIPYRWRRPGQDVSETRQTQLILCYNGPSNG